MNSDQTTEAPSRPVRSKPRWYHVTIREIMVIILIISLGLGYFFYRIRSHDRVFDAEHRVVAWIAGIQAEESLSFERSHTYPGGDWITTRSGYWGRFFTPTRHPITIKAEMRAGPLGYSGQVVITAEGRSVTWPIEDIERGRKIDLKAEFPEAFR